VNFHTGWYAERSDIIVDRVLRRLEHSRIIDIAAGSTYLAGRFLARPEVTRYAWNDLNLSILKGFGEDESRFEVWPFDANRPPLMDAWEVVICVSLEHLEHDFKLLEAVKPGAFLALSSPNFMCKGHVRSFKTRREFRERYEPYVNIEEIAEVKKGRLRKFVLFGEKKPGGR
jgi:2-polyprenyl-3-methyl-5-hydroxy-6-metoxy-1,4-benzoquinol methylase